MGGSILESLGLNELVCSELSQYENLIVSLAEDPARCIAIKKQLIKRIEQLQTNTCHIASEIEKQLIVLLNT